VHFLCDTIWTNWCCYPSDGADVIPYYERGYIEAEEKGRIKKTSKERKNVIPHKCKLVADITIFHKDKVLLVKYKSVNKYDHQQGWFLPDDTLHELEHPEIAAKRIIEEQLGIRIDNLYLNHIESFKGNDKSWHIVFHYKSEIGEGIKMELSTDIKEMKWFASNKLPEREEIAHKGWALATISKVLKG